MSIYYWLGAMLTGAMFATGVWLILGWARDRRHFHAARTTEERN